jgi:hypothetical protein
MQYRNAWTINFYEGENLLYVTSDALKTDEYTFPLLVMTIFKLLNF